MRLRRHEELPSRVCFHLTHRKRIEMHLSDIEIHNILALYSCDISVLLVTSADGKFAYPAFVL
jgi:hypothetical protein